jgi:hypothetical protein
MIRGKRILKVIIFCICFFILPPVLIIRGLKEEREISQNGIETEAVVFFCGKMHSPPRSASKGWVSKAVYYVERTTYTYIVDGKLPVGTKFKVKYLPQNPKKAMLADENELDKYPKYGDD